ncbi:hypothetical protein JCM10207_006369 [Rhodosporidiobolus poonsookiae]
MRFHCLGVGSIGSLFASNLASLPSAQVRLILRRKDLASQLLNAPAPSASAPPGSTPEGSLTVERNGIARRVSGLEMELTRSRSDAFETSSLSSPSSPSPRIDPRLWNRNDPIETLFITTKAPSTLPAMRDLLPRLSSRSTVVLCQNGMGVLEGLLAKYWPEDRSDQLEAEALQRGGTADWHHWGRAGGRPSFVCATTTHGAWRKGAAHFVHAGMGDVKFGVVPNRAVQSTLTSYPDPAWGSPADNPLLNPRSLVSPTLDHLPYTPSTATLHTTVASLLALNDLAPSWLPLPTLQIAQLQKLAVNASVNSITALAGVNNGALVGSQKAKRVIQSVTQECSAIFAAHLAREEGTWAPPPALDDRADGLFPSSFPFSAEHPPPPSLPHEHPLSAHSLLDYTLRVIFKTAPNISSTLADLLSLQTPAPFSLSQNAPSLPSRTEIEYINGYVVALGRRYGLAAPTVHALGELVLLKEEMGRVGAVDRMWDSRRGPGRKAMTPPPPPPPPPKSRAQKARAGAKGGQGGKGGNGAAQRPTQPKRAHVRNETYAQHRRENEGVRHRNEVERIRRLEERGQGG